MTPDRRAVLKSAGASTLGLGLVSLTGSGRVAAESTSVTRPPAFDGWQAGDLHCHTTYSHDVCETPVCEEPYTYGFTVNEQIGNAERRGLDYLALTDHNTLAQTDDPDFGSSSVTLLDSYEHSLAKGHGGMHGVPKVYERPTNNTGQLRAVITELHRDGGFGVVNHPRTEISSTWEYEGLGGMDAIEVWSIAWYLEYTPLSSHNPAALAFYDELLNDGHRLAAVGGSDNHWKSTHAVQGVGQPTTWVYAPEGDRRSILDGVRAGRTFISWDWRGPLVTIGASLDGDGYEYSIGDVAPTPESEYVAIKMTVANALGDRIRLVVDGEVQKETRVPKTPFTWETTVEVADDPGDKKGHNWVRAEVLHEESTLMQALTSPIYFAHRSSLDESSSCDCHSPDQRRALVDRRSALDISSD